MVTYACQNHVGICTRNSSVIFRTSDIFAKNVFEGRQVSSSRRMQNCWEWFISACGQKPKFGVSVLSSSGLRHSHGFPGQLRVLISQLPHWQFVASYHSNTQQCKLHMEADSQRCFMLLSRNVMFAACGILCVYYRTSFLTLRRLMSYIYIYISIYIYIYIYGAPILDVSRSHTTTQHSR